MGAHDFELCVEIEGQVNESCESSSGVAGRERFERVVNLLGVACAYFTIVHQGGKAGASGSGVGSYRWFTDRVEMRTETTYVVALVGIKVESEHTSRTDQ